jgi:hypothetical protein
VFVNCRVLILDIVYNSKRLLLPWSPVSQCVLIKHVCIVTKSVYSFHNACPSVCPHIISVPPTGWTTMKFDLGYIHENLLRISKFG